MKYIFSIIVILFLTACNNTEPTPNTASTSSAKKLFENKQYKESVAIFKQQNTAEAQYFLGKAYSKRGWVMQLHIGALRNNSKRMYQTIGPDTGFDSTNDTVFAAALSALLDDLDYSDELPKTIIYPLNPRDNYVIGTMIGNFQGGGIKGKIQFGSGWWFCDQKEGMLDQMKTLSNLGLISRFIGMLTDSRSFLSYTRHEYFRRILCNLIGEWVENGEYPNDIEFLGQVVQNISYNNAANYFNI
jgi:glucuronate isomerase